MQYKAEHLGWSGSLLLQTEAALIGDHGREQIDNRYVLYMTPLQKTRTIALKEDSDAKYEQLRQAFILKKKLLSSLKIERQTNRLGK